LDKLKELLNKLFEKIEDVEQIAVHNNNLLGFMLSNRAKSEKPKSAVYFNPETHKILAIHLDMELMEYLEENNISLDSFGDA
tara:strand:- start:8822 stop:9067 length:246 start_codon:yes stop_codon:yes gene_type:complete